MSNVKRTENATIASPNLKETKAKRKKTIEPQARSKRPKQASSVSQQSNNWIIFMGITVFPSDITCLCPGELLNDNAVQMFIERACGNNERIHVFTTFQYTSWRNGQSHISSYAGRNQTIFRKDLWMIPINQEEHWQLLCITKPYSCNPNILLMDSYTSKPANTNQVRQFALALLDDSHYAINGTNVEYRENIPKVCVPKQGNGYDCGVFTILNAEHALMNIEELLELNCKCLDLSSWYTTIAGNQYRAQLHRQFQIIIQRI